MLFFEIIIPVLSLVTLGAAYRIVDVGISMAGFPLDSLTPALAPPIYNIDLHVVANSTGGSFSSKQCNDELLMMVYDCQGTERIISTANGSWVYNTNDCWQRKCAVGTDTRGENGVVANVPLVRSSPPLSTVWRPSLCPRGASRLVHTKPPRTVSCPTAPCVTQSSRSTPSPTSGAVPARSRSPPS